MPPRARKTAAAKPAADPATLDAPETVPADAEVGATAPETDEQAQPEPDPAADAPPAADAVADNPAPVEPSDGATQAPPAFHWQTSTGTPGDPCRLCLPGGIPETAGSIGCQHGQWVRVWDGNQ